MPFFRWGLFDPQGTDTDQSKLSSKDTWSTSKPDFPHNSTPRMLSGWSPHDTPLEFLFDKIYLSGIFFFTFRIPNDKQLVDCLSKKRYIDFLFTRISGPYRPFEILAPAGGLVALIPQFDE